MILALAARGPVETWLQHNLWVIPIFVVAWGWFLIQSIARISGWSRLAEQYRANQPFQGEKWRFQSVQMRYLSHYNNCVTFGTDFQGLYIAMMFIVRPGHPPLLIPWEELEIRPKQRFFTNGHELSFPRVPGVTMWVLPRLGEKIVRAARERGPGLRVAPQIG